MSDDMEELGALLQSYKQRCVEQDARIRQQRDLLERTIGLLRAILDDINDEALSLEIADATPAKLRKEQADENR